MSVSKRITAFLLILALLSVLFGCAVNVAPSVSMSSADEASAMEFCAKDGAPQEVRVGEYVFLDVNIKPDCEPYVNWYSTNPEVATVDNNGRVDGKAQGEVTIVAKAKSAEVEYPIAVKAAKKTSLSNTTAYLCGSNVTDILNQNLSDESGKNPYALLVNLSNNTVVAYTYNGDVYDKAVRQMLCATDAGDNILLEYDYYIGDKERWYEDSEGLCYQYSSWISDEYRFCSAPYEKEDEASLIAQEYNKLGTACTKGDIWLSAADAQWIYENCGEGTRVKVYENSKSPLGVPAPLILTENSLSNKWDPTDSSDKNPYKNAGPTFEGVEDTTVTRGGAFDPMDGVAAYDTCSNAVEYGVYTDGTVLCNKAGIYIVSYFYTDGFKRTTRVDRVVTVEKP